jgi:hypothetical protein
MKLDGEDVRGQSKLKKAKDRRSFTIPKLMIIRKFLSWNLNKPKGG